MTAARELSGSRHPAGRDRLHHGRHVADCQTDDVGTAVVAMNLENQVLAVPPAVDERTMLPQ